jgi:hypothetical protein
MILVAVQRLRVNLFSLRGSNVHAKETQRLVDALVRIKPKPHERMKVGKKVKKSKLKTSTKPRLSRTSHWRYPASVSIAMVMATLR